MRETSGLAKHFKEANAAGVKRNRVRSARRASRRLTPIEAVRKAVKHCCPRCEYDEAEGGLVNHCDACCRKIVTDVYGIAVLGEVPA